MLLPLLLPGVDVEKMELAQVVGIQVQLVHQERDLHETNSLRTARARRKGKGDG